MAFAGLQLGPTDRRILGDREDQVVEFGLALPISGMGLVADQRVLAVGDILERSGADRQQIDFRLAARRRHLVGVLFRHDRGKGHGHVGDERRLGLGEREAHRHCVDFLDRLQQFGHAH